MVAGVPNYKYGAEGELFTSALKGRYTERALRGNLFRFGLGATSTGVAAGNISGAAGGASTQFAVWNPSGSGKNLALLSLYVMPISGTPPGGAILHNMASTVPSIATVGTINNALPSSSVATVAKGVASAAGTALTSGGALSMVGISSIGFAAAAFSTAGLFTGIEDLGGSLIIPPGWMWVPCWAAAGTTLLNSWGALWEEVAQ